MNQFLALSRISWILWIAFGLAAACEADTPPPKKEKLVPVLVAKVQYLAAGNKIELPGTVLPWAITRLAAEVDGRVEKIYVQEGQFVKKGTRLLQLRITPLKLERDLALAERALVENSLDELRTGTRVEVLDAAKAALAKAKATLQLGISELKRTDKLHKDGVLSVNKYDNARSVAEAAQALYREKKAQLQELQEGPRIETIRQEEAKLSAAEAKIKIIEDQIERATIYSPFEGFITKKETEIGQWLEKGDPGLTLIATHPIKVEVNLPQFYFDRVEVGTPAKVILESRKPNVPNATFDGKVIEKIHLGDPTSRTFPVRVKVANPGSKIASGMLVRVEILPSDSERKSLFVPKDAIVRSPGATVVWVVRQKQGAAPTVEKIPVTTGEYSGSLVAIDPPKGKINAGDLVVIHGNERLRPGSKIKILRAAQ